MNAGLAYALEVGLEEVQQGADAFRSFGAVDVATTLEAASRAAVSSGADKEEVLKRLEARYHQLLPTDSALDAIYPGSRVEEPAVSSDPEALVREFADVATAWRAFAGNLARQNRIADTLGARGDQLTSTPEGRMALGRLLDHHDLTVRTYAAAFLRFFPSFGAKARGTLEEIVSMDAGADSALADLTLDMWDADERDETPLP